MAPHPLITREDPAVPGGEGPLQAKTGAPITVRDAQLGAISFPQRFGSSLNPHYHYHVLALDGVISGDAERGVRFREATGLEVRDAEALARTVQLRVLRWFTRRELLDSPTAADMRRWQGTGGFSVDASVRIEGEDRAGLENDLQGAGSILERGLELTRRTRGPDHLDVAVQSLNLAAVLIRQGRHEAAQPLALEALVNLEARLGPDHPDLAHAVGILATIRGAAGSYVAADTLHLREQDLLRRSFGDGHPALAVALAAHSATLRDSGRLDEAFQRMAEAVSIERHAVGRDHVRVAVATTGLAALARMQGDLLAADTLLGAGLEILEAAFPDGHPRVWDALGLRGAILADQGRFDEAEALLTRVYGLATARGSGSDPVTRNLAGHLVALYDRTGRPGVADRYRSVIAPP